MHLRPSLLNHRSGRPAAQRGMVTAAVMLFLIATVVFALAQMLNVSSANVIDDQRQGDSTAAFFLAESGLEKAQASLGAATVGAVSNTGCTGIASSYALGRGTVTISGVSTPPTCSGAACTSCELTAVGQVGISTRTLARQAALTTRNGTFCNGPVTHNCSNTPEPHTWQLNLTNNSGFDGVAVFNLAWVSKGNNAATCAAGSNCRLQFNLGSPSAGQNSAGIMGNSVNIPNGATYPIYQVMDNADRGLVEVGAIFKGSSAAPTLTGTVGEFGGASYWNTNSSGNGTVGSIDITGNTNDGTATSTGTCANPTTANSQSCTHWCHGGDTLVFSYAAKVTSRADALTSVSFGTTAGGRQNVPLDPVAKYPTTAISGAPEDVEAEIWYARNPNLVGASPLASNASSYKGRGTGAFGATWNSANASDPSGISNGSNPAVSGDVLTVSNSFTGYPTQIISPGAVGVGDIIRSTGSGANVNCAIACPTIIAQLTSTEAGGALGGRGTYRVSAAQNVQSSNNRRWFVDSTVLNVNSCTICNFGSSDALNGALAGRSLTATSQQTLGTVATRGRVETTGGIGRYLTTNTPTLQAAGTIIQAGTPNATIYLPAGQSLPAATTPATRIAIKTGTGVLASNSTVSSVSAAGSPNAATRSFTLNATPTTPLDDVSLCAGTCAFFVPGGNTTFTIAKSAGTLEWASGFTCLKGVDVLAETVTSSSSAVTRWTEKITN